jgi:predicted nucleic acid-binding protein
VILVDTSIWIDHLRRADGVLTSLLESGNVLMHPFVFGELALGNLNPRGIVLNGLRKLPRANVAREEDVIRFVEQERLYGLGIGYVDAHLLTAVRLTPETTIWSRDQRLMVAAKRLSLAAKIFN